MDNGLGISVRVSKLAPICIDRERERERERESTYPRVVTSLFRCVSDCNTRHDDDDDAIFLVIKATSERYSYRYSL